MVIQESNSRHLRFGSTPEEELAYIRTLLLDLKGYGRIAALAQRTVLVGTVVIDIVVMVDSTSTVIVIVVIVGVLIASASTIEGIVVVAVVMASGGWSG